MTTRLIGRDALVARVVATVDGGRRAVTLLGPPGAGETRLAEAAAAHLSADRAGGVWACSVANASTEETLCLAVRSMLAPASGPGFGRQAAPVLDTASEVGTILATRGPLLLVLDDFERLVPFAGVIRRWLSMAPGLAILVTSRERLQIDDEFVIEIPSLDCPPAGAAAAARACDAVQLFEARAAEAGAPAIDDWEAVGEIVRRLDGIPLAIELAAARTRVIRPADLARRIARGLDLLGRSGRDAPARHQTLRAAIAWSWELLEPRERLALAVSSVFAGSFAASAAEDLIARALSRSGAAPGAHGPLELLAALRDKSLLRMNDGGRLSLYTSVRELAAGELDAVAPGGAAQVRHDHVRACAALARRFVDERLLQAARPLAGVAADARAEQEDLVATFELAVPSALAGAPSDEDRGDAVALASAVAFLQAMPADRCDAELARLLEAGWLTPSERAVLLLARQSSLGALGRHAEGLAVAESAIDLPGLEVGLRAAACAYAGIQVRSEGDAERATRFHERAAAMLGEVHPSRLYGMNLSCLGRLACDLRHLDEARDLNRRATATCDDRGDRFLAGLGIANLAQLEQEEGNFARAEAGYQDAVLRFGDAHEPQYEGIYAARLAGLYLEWGKVDRATLHYATAERILGRVYAPSSMVLLYAGWAAAEAEAGHVTAAAARLGEAKRFAERGAQGVMGVALELLEATVELRAPAVEPSSVAFWSSRLDGLAREQRSTARTAHANLDVRFAMRMARRALPLPPAEDTRAVLDLGPALAWFAIGGVRVALSRRGPLRRMLGALVEARLTRPGEALDRDALSRAGWPNERILDQAAASRVRVGVATLRKLGLRELLVTRDDGYLIDPRAHIERAAT